MNGTQDFPMLKPKRYNTNETKVGKWLIPKVIFGERMASMGLS
jgi:hypothetical protein